MNKQISIQKIEGIEASPDLAECVITFTDHTGNTREQVAVLCSQAEQYIGFGGETFLILTYEVLKDKHDI